MKKFFTSVPFQSTLTPCIYKPVGNTPLSYEKSHSLPILNVINNCTEKGEEIEVVFLVGDNENIKRNLEYVKKSLDELLDERQLKCKIKYIDYPDSDDISVMLELYGRLIRLCEDNDEIYSCITFGTKPVPLVQMMAMRYAYHAKKNVFIGMIVYGKAHGKMKEIDGIRKYVTDKAEIYDMTSMFYMDELSEKFCRMGIQNPEEKIAAMISGMEESENEC